MERLRQGWDVLATWFVQFHHWDISKQLAAISSSVKKKTDQCLDRRKHGRGRYASHTYFQNNMLIQQSYSWDITMLPLTVTKCVAVFLPSR